MRLTTISIILTAAMIMCLVGLSQAETPTAKDHDVIVLKNGGVARGKITETVENDYIVLEVSNGKTIKIDFEKIALTTDNQAFDPASVPAFSGSRLTKLSNYHFMTQVALLAGEQTTNYSVSAQIGPQVTEHIMLAWGLRFDRYSRNMLSGRFHVYAFGDLIPGGDGFKELQLHFSVGYGQFLNDRDETKTNGGSNVSCGIAGLFKLRGQTALMLELGYHQQSLTFRTKHASTGDFVTLSTGLRF
ncbi:MAG: hypothetical protein OEV49_11400 [candidate division Zixibacteria bacterium]|nr:hypothetical protein [candidate division Zixibacteria bacterium]MDH3937582.1 hypothetical protein [candidate division Zixibacteria bacterium]